MSDPAKVTHFPNTGNEPVPPGATNEASDRDERPGGPRHTPLDDRHAAGEPGGGSAVGGLGGTNAGEGDPDDADLHDRLGSGIDDQDGPFEEGGGPPYGGPSGGAVGGSPAEGRSSGGRTHHGIRPGGVHRGDSTLGSNPDAGTR
jgi:hypothetical protein